MILVFSANLLYICEQRVITYKMLIISLDSNVWVGECQDLHLLIPMPKWKEKKLNDNSKSFQRKTFSKLVISNKIEKL